MLFGVVFLALQVWVYQLELRKIAIAREAQIEQLRVMMVDSSKDRFFGYQGRELQRQAAEQAAQTQILAERVADLEKTTTRRAK